MIFHGLLLAFAGQKHNILSDPVLSRRITYTLRASSAKSALVDLSEASGLELLPDATVQNEVLVLRVDNEPVAEVMSRIAEAVGGSWSKRQSVFVLGRSAGDEDRRRQASAATQLRDARRVVAEAATRLVKTASVDQDAAVDLADLINATLNARFLGTRPPHRDEIPLRDRMPAGRLINWTLAHIDPEILVSSPSGVRTVFSSNPTQFETALPFETSHVLAWFISEQNLVAQAVSQLPSWPAWARLDGCPTDQVDAGSIKLDLVVDRTRWLPTDTVTVEIVDANAVVMASSQRSFGFRTPPANASLVGLPAGPAPVLSDDEKVEIRRLIHGYGMLAGAIPLNDALRSKFERPDRFEPLGTFVTSLLLQAAKALNKNLIADVPDSWLLGGAEALQRSNLGIEEWLQSVCQDRATVCSMDNGWLQVDGGALLPDLLSDERADRRLLAKLLAKGHDGFFKAEDLGSYAFSTGKPSVPALFAARLGDSWDGSLAMNTSTRTRLLADAPSAASNRSGNLPNVQSWNVLRIIGASQHTDAADSLINIQMPYSECDQGLMGVITEIMLSQRGPILGQPIVGGPHGMGFTPAYEPLDLFAMGLPGNGRVSIQVKSRTIVAPESRNQEPMNSNMFADSAFARSGSASLAAIDGRYQIGSERVIHIWLGIAGLPVIGYAYSDNQPPSGPPVRFESLPRDFIDEVTKRLRVLDQRRTKGKQGV